jgi:alkanesulfonate monooxygenase SsuD/methylene tetrahydromethanopterin reductase-like flavin-dependent oxidoreductase (luciferase family)
LKRIAMRYALDVSTTGSYADPGTLAELAADAERAGWDGFFVWDAVFGPAPTDPVVDPWIALAAVAMATRRIHVGTMVTPLARYHPWRVARETASLDRLSAGRLIVGAGLGFQARDFTAFGLDADPVLRAALLDEGLAIVAGLWSGEPFTFAGQHFRVDDVTFRPTPLQTPRIPVWIAAYWPHRRPLRRAARWDGLVPGKVDDANLTPDELRQMVAYVQAHRDRPGPFDVAICGRSPADPRQAAEVVQPWAAAGATWWRENIEDARGPLAAMRERIRRGPPAAP